MGSGIWLSNALAVHLISPYIIYNKQLLDGHIYGVNISKNLLRVNNTV